MASAALLTNELQGAGRDSAKLHLMSYVRIRGPATYALAPTRCSSG